MKPRYRFITASGSGDHVHIWRLDRFTGQCWHWLAGSREHAREIIVDLIAHPEHATP